MSVSLLSNVPHYHRLAEALDKAGSLDHYVTVVSQMNENTWPLTPAKIKAQFKGRRLRVQASKVTQLILPEILLKIPPA